MKKIFKDSTVLFLEEFGIRLLNFLAIAFVTRKISPESFGAVVTGTALMSNLVLFADCGIRTVALIETAKPAEKQRFSGSELFSIRFIAHLLFIVIPAGVIQSLNIDHTLKTVLLTYCFGLLIEGLFTDWYFRGTKNYLPSAIARLSGSFLFFLFVGINQSLTATYVALSFVIPHIVVASLLLVHSPIRLSLPDGERIKKLLRETLPVGGGKILQQLPIYLPPLLITAMAGSADTAYFGTAFKIISITMILDRILNILFLSELPTRWYDNQTKTASQIRTLYRLLLNLSALIAIGIYFLGEHALVILFGNNYGAAKDILNALVLFYLFTLLNSVVSHSIIALKNSVRYLRVSVIASAVTLPLLPVLIHFWGALGAAGAIAIAEGAIFLFSAREMRSLISLPVIVTIVFVLLNALLLFPTNNTVDLVVLLGIVTTIIVNTMMILSEKRQNKATL